jgi:hypothetical protein
VRSGDTEAATVAHALQVTPVAVDFVLGRRELVPREAGFYAWWAHRGAIDGMPRQPHPLEDDLDLLYVRISPSRATSQQNIHKRVFGHHLGGNTGSSTFRFALASLLLDNLELSPATHGRKTVLRRDDNRRLGDWQRENLRLKWCVRPQPWEVEDDVIALMQPSLNCAGNASHPFFPRIHDARDRFRRRGTSS